MAKILLTLSSFILFQSLAYGSTPLNQDGTGLLKRRWVRRIANKSALKNSVLNQSFSPLINSSGQVVQGSHTGELYKLNLLGRKERLAKNISGVSGSGSLFKNFLFFGTLDKELICLDISTDKVIWKILLNSRVTSISEFSNGRVFVLSQKGELYSIDASDGAIKWSVSFDSSKQLKVIGASKPISYKNFVIAGFPDSSIRAFNAKSGKEVWKKDLSSHVKYSDTDFFVLGNSLLVVGQYDKALYGIKPDTGSLVWTSYDNAPISEPSLNKGKVYFADNQNNLVVLDERSGSTLSKKELFKSLGSQALTLDNKVLLIDSTGRLDIYSLGDFKHLQTYDFLHSVSSTPLYYKKNKSLFIFTDKAYLFNFKLKAS